MTDGRARGAVKTRPRAGERYGADTYPVSGEKQTAAPEPGDIAGPADTGIRQTAAAQPPEPAAAAPKRDGGGRDAAALRKKAFLAGVGHVCGVAVSAAQKTLAVLVERVRALRIAHGKRGDGKGDIQE